LLQGEGASAKFGNGHWRPRGEVESSHHHHNDLVQTLKMRYYVIHGGMCSKLVTIFKLSKKL